VARGERSENHPSRRVERSSYSGDAYDAYRDYQLTHGPDIDRPRPGWFQRANAERIANDIAGRKTKNAMWPAAPQEHGPARPQ